MTGKPKPNPAAKRGSDIDDLLDDCFSHGGSKGSVDKWIETAPEEYVSHFFRVADAVLTRRSKCVKVSIPKLAPKLAEKYGAPKVFTISSLRRWLKVYAEK